MKKILINILLLTVPSLIVGLLIAELVVRLTWDKKEGVPGLVLTHPRRIEVLAPNYRGYFGGQPLRVNNLGFRDDLDYGLDKKKNTFRIIVLGDSVTFGHGCKFEETWPYLLKERLKQWAGKTDWQVWNLGVPGYDSVLELRTLEELGPKFKPDLVIVGFYENDLYAWNYHSKTTLPKWVFAVKSFLKHHFYLYAKLRYVYNVLANLKSSADFKYQCDREAYFLRRPTKPMPEADLRNFQLKHKAKDAPLPPRSDRPYNYERYKEGMPSLNEAIAQFKRYNMEGAYRIVFFINIAPDIDPDHDRFIDGVHNEMNDFFMKLLNAETPVTSSYSAFWAYKPSEVPGADGHSLAASNAVKADVSFDFLVKYFSRLGLPGNK